MANPQRELTYGSYQIVPHGGLTWEIDERASVTVKCGVLVQADTAAAYKTALVAAQTSLQAANQTLTIVVNGQTMATYNPSTNTALRPRVRLSSPQPIRNLAALLEWTYKAQLPAQAFRGDTAQGGYVDGKIDLNLDQANRAIYSFSGEYRSEPGGTPATARELVESGTVGIKKRIEDWLDANAIYWNSSWGDRHNSYKITVRTDSADWTGASDYPGAVLTFTATARLSLIPTNEDQDGLAVNYTVEDLTIQGQRVANWSRSSGDQPYTFSVSCTVVIDAVQDDYDDLADTYQAEIKPFLEAHLEKVVGGSVAGVVSSGGDGRDPTWVVKDEAYGFNTTGNRCDVRWMCQRDINQGWLSLKAESSFDHDERNQYIKKADGQDHTHDVQSPGAVLRGSERYIGSYFSRSKVGRDQIEALIPLIGGRWNNDRRRIPLLSPLEVTTFGGGSGWLHDVIVERSYTYVIATDNGIGSSGDFSSIVGRPRTVGGGADGGEPGQAI